MCGGGPLLQITIQKPWQVASCFLVVEPRTRISRGFAFVTMDNVDDANRCIKYLNQSVLEGRYITVEKVLCTPRFSLMIVTEETAKNSNAGTLSGLKSNRDYGYRGDRGRYRGRDDYRRSPRRSPYRGGRDYSPRHSPYRGARDYSPRHSPYGGRSRRERSRSPYSPPYRSASYEIGRAWGGLDIWVITGALLVLQTLIGLWYGTIQPNVLISPVWVALNYFIEQMQDGYKICNI
ncbi:hypothetical protein GH714_034763 [Hevea brasiliensis]|uniref:RRM domain-containing protein n=1 Tax=Hevea brasiliensis TaxID=3981 RepID=A0A6A6MGR4_HEVBR|nr:hypothetical protein GH714_034763 [Hevea brasiliensis]